MQQIVKMMMMMMMDDHDEGRGTNVPFKYRQQRTKIYVTSIIRENVARLYSDKKLQGNKPMLKHGMGTNLACSS